MKRIPITPQPRTFLFVAALLATLPATAQSPWYVGIAGGEVKTGKELVANRENTITGPVTDVATRFDDRDSAWKAFAGYRINEALALEVHYADLGRHRMETSLRASGLPGTIDINREVKGHGVSLVVSLPPLGRIQAHGRAGLMRATIDADATLGGAVFFTSGTAGETFRATRLKETVGTIGLGVTCRVSRRWSVRLDWDRALAVGKAFAVGGSGTTGEADMDMVSLGAQFRF